MTYTHGDFSFVFPTKKTSVATHVWHHIKRLPLSPRALFHGVASVVGAWPEQKVTQQTPILDLIAEAA